MSEEPRLTSDRAIAFPVLSERQIDALRHWGEERETMAGEVLFAEGERGFPWFVVLAGSVEIVEHSRGTPHVVVVHQPGHFTGDVDTLSGRAALVSARVLASGRVLVVRADALRRLLDEVPDVGEQVLRAFLMRRTLLIDDGFQGM